MTCVAVVLIGPPAAGKSTAARAVLSATGDIAHFKVRASIQQLVAESDPVALSCRAQIVRREVLPDSVVRHAFSTFERKHRWARILLVEGYPKTTTQLRDLCEVMEAAGGRVAGALVVDAPDALLRRRARNRICCPSCDHSASSVERACPDCGDWMSARPDDEPHLLEQRLRAYRRTGPGNPGRFHGMPVRILDGEAPSVIVAQQLLVALDELARD